MNYSTYNFNADDGKKLVVHQWKPHDREPAFIVQIIHGIAEHTARYSDFAQKLTANGILVTGFDQRGHGKTDSQNPGLFEGSDSFHRTVCDLHGFFCFLEKRHQGLPVILFAHSMGSFITQRYMQLHEHNPAGIIYSGSSGRPARTPVDWLSRDEEQVDRYIADPLCGFVLSVSFYYHLFRGLKNLHSHKPFAVQDPDIPVLLLSGGSDPVSNMAKGVDNLELLLISSGVKNIRKKIYPHGRHEMLNEINLDEVFGDVMKWCFSTIEM